MYHVGYAPYELWHTFYALYLLWVAGLSLFFVLASCKDSFAILERAKRHWIGCIGIVWIGLSILAAGFVWPVLLAGPFMLIGMGAPIQAAIIAGGYFLISFWLSGRVLMQRWSFIGRF